MTTTRAAAIEASGWGERFHLFQVRNACFWVLLWGLAAGLLRLVGYFGPGLDSYGVGLGIGTLAFGLYTVPWLLVLGHHNRYTSLPGPLLTVAFVWGALAAAFAMALPGNGALLSLYGKAFGQGWVSDWGAGMTAPFIEESAKATALVLLVGLAPRLVRSAYDGLMIGAFAGLGFQILEDVLYAFNSAAEGFGADQAGAAWQIVLVRTLSGLTGHVLFSAVFCAGLMWLVGRAEPGHRLRGLLLVVAAMVAHGAWDDAAALGTVLFGDAGAALLMLLLPVLDLLLLALVFRLAAPQEQRWTRAILEPEIAGGVLTEAEVGAVSGGYRARRSHRRSLHGRRERRAAKHVTAAAHDLARELARTGGRDDPGVEHARAEVTRVRTV